MEEKYNRNGKCTLFSNKKVKAEGGNPKLPDLSGSFHAHRDIKAGEQIRIALWLARDDQGTLKTTSKGSQYFTGKISDSTNTFSGDQGTLTDAAIDQSSKPVEIKADELSVDDDIPF